ncbi:hypothetical protein THAOC_32358 [Thalassiosira oceanica]|uniref:Uncharacterized protein n=1 Tax=Thalassiosira oceanica TaxID=159749 RepID=K0RIS9_THAOC|nr:hypothetical protein THAOC_32358 [Thalassiosira oceanica]|eukprot:EJK48811.1 hypothetical protein THAOC_32358 [Thalassiosira oceanica]
MAKRNARDEEDGHEEHYQDKVVNSTSAHLPRSELNPSAATRDTRSAYSALDGAQIGRTTPDTEASTPSPERDPHSWIYHLRAREERRSRRSTTPESSLPGPHRGSSRSSPRIITSVPQATGTYVDTEENETLATGLNQELRDAELASWLKSEVPARLSEKASAAFPDDSATEITVRSGDSSADSPSSRCTRRDARPTTLTDKVLYYGLRIISLVIVLVMTFLVWSTVYGSRAIDQPDPTARLPGWPDEDPFLGAVGDHSVWDTEGRSGLTLQVLNNLDPNSSNWREILVHSIQQWNDGSPKAVEVNIREVTYDPDCHAVRKALKVCNGNYGPTNWRGYNQILLQGEYILASVAFLE